MRYRTDELCDGTHAVKHGITLSNARRRTLRGPMTPREESFNDGMELASSRMRHGIRTSYWSGYVVGLMRGLFGPEAVTNSQHHVLSSRETMDEAVLGYRDGYDRIAKAWLWQRRAEFATHASASPAVAGRTESDELQSRAGSIPQIRDMGAEAWENEGGATKAR